MNFTGKAELPLDAENGPALGRAVQLGQDDAGALDRLLEHLRLGDGVLAAGGIEHQQHLVRRTLDPAADHAANLFQLAHQVGLRVQSAGRVDDQHVEAACPGLLAGVVGHAGRVAALLRS